MSQGDLYRLADSERRGIEVSRDGGFVDWAEIVDDWPFPLRPVLIQPGPTHPHSPAVLRRAGFQGGSVTQEQEILDSLHVGARVWFDGERNGYTVQARSDRFIVCTKPFAPRQTVLYTVIDAAHGVRGTEGLVFEACAESPKQCEDMVERLDSGFTNLSWRNRVPLLIRKAEYTAGAR